jgi:hypothetical protein
VEFDSFYARSRHNGGGGMAIKKRYLIEIDDILSIRWSCIKCEASLNIPIFENRKVPVTCYNCNERFFKEGYNPTIENILERLSVFKTQKDPATFNIQIEIEQPESKQDEL